MGKLHLSYPANIAKVTVQKKRFNILGVGLYHVPFLILYVFALKACYETSGTPYNTALAHHKGKGYDPEALATKTSAAAKPAVVDEWGGKGGAGGGSGEDDPWGDLEDDEPEAVTTASATASATAAVEAAASASADADADDSSSAAADGVAVTNGTDANGTAVNATALEELITYETPPSLPARWLPEFWAVAAFSALAVSHALLMFSQHWSVRFKAFVNYKESDAVDTDKFFMFCPMPHQGGARVQGSNPVVTHSLKPPGFTTLAPIT
jgi:hypothetical protein